MRTFSFLKGSKAVDMHSRKPIGKVEDIVTDAKGNVQGFILCENRRFFRKRYLPYSSAVVEDREGLLLCSSKPFKVPYYSEGTFMIAKRPCCILKQPLLSKDGETEAVVEEVYFSNDWGRIVAVEVTKGLFSDWAEGRSLIYPHEPLTIGEQSLFVR